MEHLTKSSEVITQDQQEEQEMSYEVSREEYNRVYKDLAQEEEEDGGE